MIGHNVQSAASVPFHDPNYRHVNFHYVDSTPFYQFTFKVRWSGLLRRY